MAGRDPWRVLGIERGVGLESIRDAYRSAARRLRPNADPLGSMRVREAYLVANAWALLDIMPREPGSSRGAPLEDAALDRGVISALDAFAACEVEGALKEAKTLFEASRALERADHLQFERLVGLAELTSIASTAPVLTVAALATRLLQPKDTNSVAAWSDLRPFGRSLDHRPLLADLCEQMVILDAPAPPTRRDRFEWKVMAVVGALLSGLAVEVLSYAMRELSQRADAHVAARVGMVGAEGSTVPAPAHAPASPKSNPVDIGFGARLVAEGPDLCRAPIRFCLRGNQESCFAGSADACRVARAVELAIQRHDCVAFEVLRGRALPESDDHDPEQVAFRGYLERRLHADVCPP